MRGPDLLWGGDIRKFHPPAGKFDGVIGGPPCQAFSRLVHIVRYNGYKIGENLIPEFQRVVGEVQPRWFLMENVEAAPMPRVNGYNVEGYLLNNRWLGEVQSRLHRFSFGTRDERKLEFHLAALEAFDWDYRVCASDSRRTPVKLNGGHQPKWWLRKGCLSARGRARRLDEMLRLQGLPEDFFDHSPFTMRGKGEMLGNGVSLPMGIELARAIKRALVDSLT